MAPWLPQAPPTGAFEDPPKAGGEAAGGAGGGGISAAFAIRRNSWNFMNS